MQPLRNGYFIPSTEETFIVCTRYFAEGKTHAGIILAQQRYSIGQQLRQILELVGSKPLEEMRNNAVFLKE
jgi:hypothetical protein